MENNINKIVENAGLQPIQAKPLLDSFGDLFVQAHKITTLSKAIKVTSELQIDDMRRAREMRLELKNLRNEADKVRVSLKEGYLRGGNAVQTIFNNIRDIVKPEEDRLEKQEKFIEIQEFERIEKRFIERTDRLRPFVENVDYFHYKGMTDEAFETLLSSCKAGFETAQKVKEQEEKDRIEKEQKYKAEQEKIRKENERLKALRDKDKEKIRKLKEEKEAFELQEKKKNEDSLAKAKEVLDRAEQARLAPDKEKCRVYTQSLIDIECPTVSNVSIALKIQTIRNFLIKVNTEYNL